MSSISASSTTSINCGCCHHPPSPCFTLGTALLECRIRGGTATLIGFSEYTTPSSPPRKFRIETIGGSFFTCDSDPTLSGQVPASCAGPRITVSHRDYSGAASYNALTGVLTNNQKDQFFITSNSIVQPCTPAGAFSTNETFALPFQPRGGTVCPTGAPATSLSTTAAVYTYCGTCFMISSVDYRVISGSVNAALTDEDLESDAITRLLAGAGGTWGAWIAPGGVGCTGGPPSCCIASYEQRTTLFTFAYQPSQFRITVSGLTPSTAYHISVNIKRSVRGAGVYTIIATHVYAFTSDGSGNYVLTDDIPNAVGYDTTIDNSAGAICVYV